MSGARSWILLIASRPLSASAQTHPVCSSSINLHSPDRKGTLPSAIRTRAKENLSCTMLSSFVHPVNPVNQCDGLGEYPIRLRK
jgi:hypothetical protein